MFLKYHLMASSNSDDVLKSFEQYIFKGFFKDQILSLSVKPENQNQVRFTKDFTRAVLLLSTHSLPPPPDISTSE